MYLFLPPWPWLIDLHNFLVLTAVHFHHLLGLRLLLQHLLDSSDWQYILYNFGLLHFRWNWLVCCIFLGSSACKSFHGCWGWWAKNWAKCCLSVGDGSRGWPHLSGFWKLAFDFVFRLRNVCKFDVIFTEKAKKYLFLDKFGILR